MRTSLLFFPSLIFILLFVVSEHARGQSSFLEIDASSNAEFVVIDPQGHRTGKDLLTDEEVSEIPHARYTYEGVEDEDRYMPQFITEPSGPPVNGIYRIKLVGGEAGSVRLGYAAGRGTTRSSQYLSSTIGVGGTQYYELTFDNSPSIPMTFSRAFVRQVAGGIFHIGNGVLSIKAKPSISFSSGNSLKTAVATIRWLASYGIALGTVSSSYGFAKWDSVITIGSYKYQKFRTTASTSINWAAQAEQELFTVPVSGGSGTGTFELTNQIPGGEWFVDINYSDKSDTTFYHPVAEETPLPIQLSSFTASVLTGGRVRLSWTTISEINNYGFEMQKSRDSLSGYWTISNSFVPGHGTTNEPQSYFFIDSAASPGTTFYRLRQIDLSGTVDSSHVLRVSVPSRTYDMRGGLFNPTGATLSMKVKPRTSCGPADTLQSAVATVRWPSQYNVAFGTVSSGYGFSKWDSVVTVGSYKYQKFRTTTVQAIHWLADAEYELLNVPVTGYCGIENYDFTNTLAGGEWQIQISGFNKADTSFYQAVAQGFAYQNKSTGSGALSFNSQRHLARAQNRLHEVFVSNGEVIYRRSSNDGTTWDATTRLSAGAGGAITACVAASADNSTIHTVWERTAGSNVELLYAHSTDLGVSWSAASALPGCGSLVPSSSQAGSVHPALAELNGSPRDLMVVFADQGGLKYQHSTTGGSSWATSFTALAPTLKSSSYNPNIWYLSLAQASSFLILTYDYRYSSTNAVCSRAYTQSAGWTSENYVATGTGTSYDRCTSVMVDNNNTPIVSWCAQKPPSYDYRILYRQGTSTLNTWSSGYTEFAPTVGVSDIYPSTTFYYTSGGPSGPQVFYQRSNNEVRYNQMINGPWSNYLLATNAQYVSSTGTLIGANLYPIRAWSDQSGPPYQIAFTAGGGLSPLVASAETGTGSSGEGTYSTPDAGSSSPSQSGKPFTRTVVLEEVQNHALMRVEVSPWKIMAGKDTLLLAFTKQSLQADPMASFSVTGDSVWEFLSSDSFTLPAQGPQTLAMNLHLQAPSVPGDSSTTAGGSVIASSAAQQANPFSTSPIGVRLELTCPGVTGKTLTLVNESLGINELSSPRQITLPKDWAGTANVRVKLALNFGDTLTGRVKPQGLGTLVRQATGD